MECICKHQQCHSFVWFNPFIVLFNDFVSSKIGKLISCSRQAIKEICYKIFLVLQFVQYFAYCLYMLELSGMPPCLVFLNLTWKFSAFDQLSANERKLISRKCQAKIIVTFSQLLPFNFYYCP